MNLDVEKSYDEQINRRYLSMLVELNNIIQDTPARKYGNFQFVIRVSREKRYNMIVAEASWLSNQPYGKDIRETIESYGFSPTFDRNKGLIWLN